MQNEEENEEEDVFLKLIFIAGIEMACYEASKDILKILTDSLWPVPIGKLVEMTELEEIDVMERVEWLNEKKVIQFVPIVIQSGNPPPRSGIVLRCGLKSTSPGSDLCIVHFDPNGNGYEACVQCCFPDYAQRRCNNFSILKPGDHNWLTS